MILEGPSIDKNIPVSEWPEIVRLKAGLCNMQICTTIPPERKHEINDKLKECGLQYSGTTFGWQLDEEITPVECQEARGKRWHYVCKC